MCHIKKVCDWSKAFKVYQMHIFILTSTFIYESYWNWFRESLISTVTSWFCHPGAFLYMKETTYLSESFSFSCDVPPSYHTQVCMIILYYEKVKIRCIYLTRIKKYIKKYYTRIASPNVVFQLTHRLENCHGSHHTRQWQIHLHPCSTLSESVLNNTRPNVWEPCSLLHHCWSIKWRACI